MRVVELARQVGVTPSLISQIERGLSRPSVSTLFAIAQALHKPVDAFFHEPQTASAAAEDPDASASRIEYDDDAGNPSAGATGQEQARLASGSANGRYVMRQSSRATIDIEGGVRWERLTRTTLDHLDFFELIYEPGARSHPRQYTHPGAEMVLVLSGRLEITVGFDSYLLEPGDSIDFPSSMPHRYVNPGSETARAVTVILYDCPDGRSQPPPDARA
jgi:quercetin dioxygenase-like cupin family protein/DNA-binding XRE family transcriptional regulator